MRRVSRPGSTWRTGTVACAAAVVLSAGLAAVAAPVAGASPGQTVTPIGPGTTPEDLVDTLLGGGITVSNVTFAGAEEAAGLFSGMGVVGFDSGIVLSTGAAADVVGPNNDVEWTTEFATAGDADLDAIVAPLQTEDAVVLEFDFVPSTAQISFRYVFGSEEYNEFVNSEFNDVFAFFVNGANCAKVPGTDDAVSVNTVNGGNPFGTDATNPTFYRNNSTDDPGPATLDTQLDGLTTVFTCTAAVNAGVTNHLKLALADTSDGELDTAVFLEALSLEAEQAPVCPDQSLSTTTGAALPITLAATDANPDDTLTYAVATQPAHGTLAGTAPSLTYTSASGFVGTDSFMYTASDGVLTCQAGTVNIAVTAPPPSTVAPTTAPAKPAAAAPTYAG